MPCSKQMTVRSRKWVILQKQQGQLLWWCRFSCTCPCCFCCQRIFSKRRYFTTLSWARSDNEQKIFVNSTENTVQRMRVVLILSSGNFIETVVLYFIVNTFVNLRITKYKKLFKSKPTLKLLTVVSFKLRNLKCFSNRLYVCLWIRPRNIHATVHKTCNQ